MMVERHPPVAWPGSRLWYYPLPYQAVATFGALWALEALTRRRAGSGSRWLPLALGALVVLNVLAWPAMRATMNADPPFEEQAANSAAFVRSFRGGLADLQLDGSNRIFYFECLSRFPRLAARARNQVGEGEGFSRSELRDGRLVAWAQKRRAAHRLDAPGGALPASREAPGCARARRSRSSSGRAVHVSWARFIASRPRTVSNASASSQSWATVRTPSRSCRRFRRRSCPERRAARGRHTCWSCRSWCCRLPSRGRPSRRRRPPLWTRVSPAARLSRDPSRHLILGDQPSAARTTASRLRWLWPALAALLAVAPVLFWGGGVIEEEALGFQRNFWGAPARAAADLRDPGVRRLPGTRAELRDRLPRRAVDAGARLARRARLRRPERPAGLARPRADRALARARRAAGPRPRPAAGWSCCCTSATSPSRARRDSSTARRSRSSPRCCSSCCSCSWPSTAGRGSDA